MNLYEKCTAKSYYFSVTDTTVESDNPLGFRKNYLERIMTVDDKIRNSKLQYEI